MNRYYDLYLCSVRSETRSHGSIKLIFYLQVSRYTLLEDGIEIQHLNSFSQYLNSLRCERGINSIAELVLLIGIYFC